MKHIIEGISRCIVSEDIQVSVDEGLYQTTFTVEAPDREVGKLVGKKGRTISAIRTLMDMAAEKQGEITLYNVWVRGSTAPTSVGI